MKFSKQYTPDSLEEVLSKAVSESEAEILLYNDDFNTFDFVIDSLVELCDHAPCQAEQCAWIVHHKGKCVVKKGARETLDSICRKMNYRGLTAEVV